MGRNKLLLPYNNKTVIESTLSGVLPFSGRIIVVTGNMKAEIEDVLAPYSVETVFNPDYEKGQLSSTLTGLKEVDDDDFAILPSDLPLLSKEDVETLFRGLVESSIVRPVHNGIPGHPVCYRRENLHRLLDFGGTMKDYLKKEGFTRIPSSIGTVYDVDTPRRYDALSVFDGNLSVLENYID